MTITIGSTTFADAASALTYAQGFHNERLLATLGVFVGTTRLSVSQIASWVRTGTLP